MHTISRRFSEDDIRERVNWINNPMVNKTMYFELPATIEKTQRWFSDNRDNKSRVDFTFVNENSVSLAMGGLTCINYEHGNAEYYIMVNPQMQGKGIGKKTSIWIYNYGFSVLNLHKIYLYTDSANLAACKIYEKVGFKLEGIMRQHKQKNGEYLDRRLYGLLKTEWETLDWKKEINDGV